MQRKRIAALAAAASLALAGCGSQAATSNDPNSSGTQQTQPGGPGMDFSALATKLGVSVEKLQAAMQKNRPQQGEQPSDSVHRPSHHGPSPPRRP